MIDFETLSPDAPAIVLLCTSLGEARSSGQGRPLGPVAYSDLAERLRRQSFQGPRDLIGLDAAAISRSLEIGIDQAADIERRLERAGRIGFEFDRLRSNGVWFMTVADETYPEELRRRLGASAPPVLFGTGDADLMRAGGIAIVGSRDADEDATAFAARLATAAALGSTPVVSGGARGIDVTAMRAAFEAGGTVVGVVPEGVERRLREGSTRSAVAEGRAVLVSPYHPMAAFSAGAAMGRNKLIYALSGVAVIVSSSEGSGGTWAGAIEAVKGGWVPVLVRSGPGTPPGNAALVARGARALPAEALPSSLSPGELLEMSVPTKVAETSSEYGQQGLFDDS
jgi:predicted Rossmann fold nucleotide-binding protein DprA/Smf involved in DNA uptake